MTESFIHCWDMNKVRIYPIHHSNIEVIYLLDIFPQLINKQLLRLCFFALIHIFSIIMICLSERIFSLFIFHSWLFLDFMESCRFISSVVQHEYRRITSSYTLIMRSIFLSFLLELIIIVILEQRSWIYILKAKEKSGKFSFVFIFETCNNQSFHWHLNQVAVHVMIICDIVSS